MTQKTSPLAADQLPANTRERVLSLAAKAVLQDRNRQYGSPEDSFGRIAHFWSIFLGVDITPSDVAPMLALLKIARLAENPTHEDSYVDLAGYAACGAEVAEKAARTKALGG